MVEMALAEPLARIRPRIVATMGTVISFDVRDPGLPDAGLDEAIAWLTDVDARFSPYRPASLVSRLGRGELELDACPADVRLVLTRCEALRVETDGFFDIRGTGLRGGFDPSGYVKGWAVEEAAHILEAAGARNYVINAGGDVIVRGSPEPGRSWIVGIRHPLEPDQVVARLAVRGSLERSAVATSGLYERGGHIIDPHTGISPVELLSMTVAGPSLAVADAYATASFAMGRDGLSWLAGRPAYGGYAIDSQLRPAWTAGLAPLILGAMDEAATTA
jgi:thiamine biosynthesis lipoprotein